MRFPEQPVQTNNLKSWDWFAGLALLLLGSAAIGAALVHRALFADGAYFFFRTVVTRGITDFDPSRQVAHYVFEGPLLFAVQYLRVRSLSALSVLYGLTLFLHPICSLAASYYVVRRREPALFLVPLLSYLLSVPTTGMFVISEAHLSVSFFWPAFLYVITAEELTTAGILALTFCSLALTRTYELALLLCITLALAMFWRIIRGRRGNFEITALWANIGILLIGTISYGVDIICYRNTVNRASAFTHFTSWSILSDYNITGIFGFVVFALGALFTKGLLSRVVVFVFGVLCIAFAVFPFVVPEHISPASHYSWRILIIVMPSALSACVLFVKAPGFDAALSDRFWTKLRVLGSGLVLVVAVWQVGVTREWCGFLTTMADDLGHRRGVVKYWESIAVVPSVGRQTVGQFAFSWTVPYTGALAGALENGRVSAIVASPPGYWYPRGESVEAEMDMLSEFQIVVDSVFMQDLHGANK